MALQEGAGLRRYNLTMQTFLPYKSFTESVRCLDDKRLGKQRVEAAQILTILTSTYVVPISKFGQPVTQRQSWTQHPAVKMWRGYEESLKVYYNLCRAEWIARGFTNNLPPLVVGTWQVALPTWIGHEEFHASHRSNLLRKDPEWYGQFGWTEPADLPYSWPV